MIQINQKLSLINFTDRNDVSRIKYLVVHYFGALGSAKNTCAYFYNTYRGASAHYFVDNTSIWQAVTDEDIAWHCGDGGRGTLKGKVTNSNSIGIEVRPYKDNTSTGSAGDKDWYFHDQTIKNLIDLLDMLMAKYNIPVENVVRHFDVTAKWCPRPFMGDDINTHYQKTGNQMWIDFKSQLGDEEMTKEQFKEMMDGYLADRAQEEPATWSAEERAWAEGLGFIKGDETGAKHYKSFATREEIITFFYRYKDLIK